MKTLWLKGVESDKHDAVKSSFKSGVDLRERLKALCADKIATAMTTHRNQYDSPSWPYEQADVIGYRRALEEIISLLEN
jgi:hypothetical protein